MWESNPPGQFYGGVDPTMPRGPIEAYWNANGASCISHLRLWNRTNVRMHLDPESSVLATIRSLGGISACVVNPLGKLPAGTLWTTTTIDHID